MTFPAVIPLKDLTNTHTEYNAKTIQQHDALYAGGESFKKIASDFLFKRAIEIERPALYQNRLDRSPYTPHVSVIDFLVSAVMKKEPVVTGPSEYWESLNSDVDGDGTDLAQLARHLLLDALLHGRSWLEIFKDDELPKDSRLQVVPAALVDDWGDGFARIHTKRTERDLLWGPDTREVERWSFLTDDEVAEYEFVKELNPIAGGTVNEQNATLVATESHDLGICPLIKLQISGAHMHVMNRVQPILVQLYNRESALQFALDQGCFAQLVLKLNTSEITKIYASEVSAIHLQVGEDAQYISPNTLVFDAAMKDLDRSRTELARVIHSLSIEAAAKVQSPRATLGATKLQQGPTDALLSSYAAPVKDQLIKAFTAIAIMRNEDPKSVVLEGMDEFNEADVSSPDEGESDDSGVEKSAMKEQVEDA
jgi:hypothetical protein